MIGVLSLLILGSTFLIIPGWIISRKNNGQSIWIMGLSIFGIISWILVTALGIGAQNLMNLSELLVVAVIAVVTAYVKMFLLDKKEIKYSLLIVYLFVGVFTILLRVFMPVISG